MLRLAKRTLLTAARVTGANTLIGKSAWRDKRLLILCYHGVSIDDEHAWNPQLYISPERLRDRLASLRDLRASILPLTEAMERLNSGTLPPRAVVLTFDDGAADFHLRALPLLKEFQAPATVYLTTYYMQRVGFPVWNVAASYLLWRARRSGLAQLDGIVHGDGALSIASAMHRQRALEAFRRKWADESTEVKHHALGLLAKRLGVDLAAMLQRRQLQLMAPEEISVLPQDLIQVELHTHRHRTPDDPVEFRRELDENRAIINDLTGREARHFCYPSGHVRRVFLPWLRDAGVLSATTCIPGLSNASHEPLLLPRLVDTSLTPRESFEGWVTGTAAFLPNRTQTLADLS